MKRSMDKNGETRNRTYDKQEPVAYGFDASYANYSSTASTASTITQPLPGQPPLPPMPPPPNTIPPPPHVFRAVPTAYVAPIQAWPHPSAAPSWQWITPQASALPPQSPREITANTFQRDVSLRSGYIRRERYQHNRIAPHVQRNNYHRKNRKQAKLDQTRNQFDQTAYFGAVLNNGFRLNWQRNNYVKPTNETIIKQIPATIPVPEPPPPPGFVNVNDNCNECVKKHGKQRKPMSISYSTRLWNLEDAQKALKIESEYNKIVRAKSLIIKFPDPDLNKEIVRKYHPGIQNIHFQSPSGPRYCFIQLEENVDIDEAIKELEKIPFGGGFLKAERKSLKDDDNPNPDEIDPYTLYIGNLPESVNVNEVKSKFPNALRIDVGFAQKMKNTRYAFIRYSTVDESIAAYKTAHNLMWDTRSIIVRFRRQRGNMCLPGESKPIVKKTKDDQNKDQQLNVNNKTQQNGAVENSLENKSSKVTKQVDSASSPSSEATNVQQTSTSEIALPSPETKIIEETMMLAEIKEEPEDYDDINISCEIPMDDEVDNDEDDEDDDDDDEEDDDDDEPENDDDEDDEDGTSSEMSMCSKLQKKDPEPADNLDPLFNQLEHATNDLMF